MVYTYQIEGIALQTGDIICTMNGKPDILPGEFWRLVGRLVPGDVDHVAIYLGRTDDVGPVSDQVHFDGEWNTERMARRRGHLFVILRCYIGCAGVSQKKSMKCGRLLPNIAWQVGKPYNLNCKR
jgi:hypothetical protein